MNFLIIAVAWFIFSLGFVNLFAEAHNEGHRRTKNPGGGLHDPGYIFGALLRLIFIAFCFAGWYWILLLN